MRLEKIILDGFKSFADRTEFVFDSDITGIVGPNGCGKSNVVDAVKWVLGEQKVKNLRSTEMADVIFGGSGSRKPLGSAEVTLVLSNPQGAASGRLPIDTEEVAGLPAHLPQRRLRVPHQRQDLPPEGPARAVHGYRRRDPRLLDHRAGAGRSVGQRVEGGPASRLRGGGRHQQVQGPQEGGPPQAGTHGAEPAAVGRHPGGSRANGCGASSCRPARPAIIWSTRSGSKSCR